MSQVTLFSGPERRRRWSEDERLQILNEDLDRNKVMLTLVGGKIVHDEGIAAP